MRQCVESAWREAGIKKNNELWFCKVMWRLFFISLSRVLLFPALGPEKRNALRESALRPQVLIRLGQWEAPGEY